MKILVVDDDRDLAELLIFLLRRAGYAVIAAHDASTALKSLQRERPDLMLLDVNLGSESGFDVLRKARRLSSTQVIMLTARGQEDDTVLGLELGAVDYVRKPFSPRELLARIAANLRTQPGEEPGPQPSLSRLEVGDVVLDEAAHAVSRNGTPVALTLTEFRLLRQLMIQANTAVSADALFGQVWGYHDASSGNVVRTTVHRLRKKIEDDPAHPVLLLTLPRVGFMLTGPTQVPGRVSASPAQETTSPGGNDAL